jgi:hypothetical protein
VVRTLLKKNAEKGAIIMYRQTLITLFAILTFAFSAFAGGLNAPSLTAPENAKVNVPIYAKNVDAITSFQFNLIYDPDVINPISDPNFGCSAGSLIGPMNVVCNVAPTGTLRVAAYGATNFSGSGPILNVEFYTGSGTTLLNLEAVYFFNQAGRVPISPHGGEVILVP